MQYPFFYAVFLVVFIYLTYLILKRGKKLKTADLMVLLFLGFWAFVGSVIVASDLFPYMRLVIILLASASFLVVGIAYYRHNKPKQTSIFKPVTSVPTRLERLRQAFFVSLVTFECIFLLSMPVLAWQVVIINGIIIVTLTDLILVGTFFLGLFMVRYMIRYFRSSEEDKRTFF